MPTPSLRETFERRHFIAGGLVLLASIPVLLAAVWDAPMNSNAVAVPAVIALTVAALIVDREQWIAEPRRQMLLTLGFGALAAATAPAAPLALLLPTLFGVEPSTSYPYVLGMAWPALGAYVMRRQALAGSGQAETTVLGRGRW